MFFLSAIKEGKKNLKIEQKNRIDFTRLLFQPCNKISLPCFITPTFVALVQDVLEITLLEPSPSDGLTCRDGCPSTLLKSLLLPLLSPPKMLSRSMFRHLMDITFSIITANILLLILTKAM